MHTWPPNFRAWSCLILSTKRKGKDAERKIVIVWVDSYFRSIQIFRYFITNILFFFRKSACHLEDSGIQFKLHENQSLALNRSQGLVSSLKLDSNFGVLLLYQYRRWEENRRKIITIIYFVEISIWALTNFL